MIPKYNYVHCNVWVIVLFGFDDQIEEQIC